MINNLDGVKYRVLIGSVSGGLFDVAHYGENEEREAIERFEELKKYEGCVYLKKLVDVNTPECRTAKWKDIKSFCSEEYDRAVDYYIDLVITRQEENDPSANWKPGDAPWEAPGMSMKDFF